MAVHCSIIASSGWQPGRRAPKPEGPIASRPNLIDPKSSARFRPEAGVFLAGGSKPIGGSAQNGAGNTIALALHQNGDAAIVVSPELIERQLDFRPGRRFP